MRISWITLWDLETTKTFSKKWMHACGDCTIQKSQPKTASASIDSTQNSGGALVVVLQELRCWQVANVQCLPCSCSFLLDCERTLFLLGWLFLLLFLSTSAINHGWFGFIKGWTHMLCFRESEFETRSNRFQLVCIVVWKGYDRLALTTMAYMWLWLWFPTWPDHTCDRFCTLL